MCFLENLARHKNSCFCIILLLSSLFFFAACQVKQSDYVDVEVVKEEIRNAKIKRLTDAQIAQEAYARGKWIADSVFAKIPTNADLCSKQPDFSVLSAEQTSFIRHISFACQVPEQVSEKEKQVWDSYFFSLNEKLTLADNLQKLDGDEILYTYPTVLENAQLVVLRIILSKKEIIRQADMKKILGN